jgi:hypothetical protein
MTNGAASPRGTVPNGGGPLPRELAERRSGTDEVRLLWHPEIDRVELSISDVATGAGFHTEVAPGDALDAFYHPYAYAPRRESLYGVVRPEKAIDDG